MLLPSGHPLWQNGIPQSIQREACFSTLILLKGSVNSL
jgi:hypothetical protein